MSSSIDTGTMGTISSAYSNGWVHCVQRGAVPGRALRALRALGGGGSTPATPGTG